MKAGVEEWGCLSVMHGKSRKFILGLKLKLHPPLCLRLEITVPVGWALNTNN